MIEWFWWAPGIYPGQTKTGEFEIIANFFMHNVCDALSSRFLL